MARSICVIDGCSQLVNGHGLCGTHYSRWRKYGDPLGGERNHAPPEERFWRRVDKRSSRECWRWLGSTTKAGYGRFQIGGKGSSYVSAHRFSYELHRGEISDELIVMHRCDVSGCVNPRHLRLGTHQDNTQDMIKKGRGCYSGEKNGNRILTERSVRKILAEPSGGQRVADKYGISRATVLSIRKRKTWRHIK